MSLRAVRLFDGGKASLALRVQWAQKGGLQPITQGLTLVDAEGKATNVFRRLWQDAFPTRQRLPDGKMAEDDGRGTDAFWENFA